MKVEVLDNWKKQFPILSKYMSNGLYMRLEFVLIGLQIEKVLSDEYRFMLFCYPLWESESERKKKIPIFKYEILNKKGLQLFIPCNNVSIDVLEEVFNCVKEQVGFVFRENLSLDNVFKLLEKVSKQFASKHNPVDWYRLFEFKLALALYLGDMYLMEKIKKEIEKEITYWDPSHFNRLFFKSIEEWKNELFERFKDRVIFMKQIDQNILNSKILKLRNSHIL